MWTPAGRSFSGGAGKPERISASGGTCFPAGPDPLGPGGMRGQGMAAGDLDKEERYLIERYGDNLVGLIAYGSRVFGKPRPGSIKDYWVIYRDYEDFHSRNEEFYRTCLNIKSTVQRQIEANKKGPNFYALKDEDAGIHIKIAVIQEDDFLRFCTIDRMVVKGRMQKPLKIIRSTEKIERGIAAARREGAAMGINLVKSEFSFSDFLFAVMKLSYLAELRPENTARKVWSIINKGRAELEKIYRPLLEELSFVEKAAGDRFRDTRPPGERKKARRETLAALRRMKWSRHTFAMILRNYSTYRMPFKYLLAKVGGEISTLFLSLFVYPVFRERTARLMVSEYRREIAEYYGEDAAECVIERVVPAGKGTYEVTVRFADGTGAASGTRTVRCIPIGKAGTEKEPIAEDSMYRFLLVARE